MFTNQKNLAYLTFAVGTAASGFAMMLAVSPNGIASSELARFTLAGGVVMACVVSCIAIPRSAKRRQLALRRLLDQLCNTDSQSMAAKQLVQRASENAADSLERETLELLSTFIQRQQEQLENAEHARQSAEVRLHRAINDHQHVSQIVSEMSEPVLAVDQHGELLLANSSARKLLRIPQHATENRAIDQLVQCETLLELIDETQHRKSSGIRTGEIQVPDDAGATRSFRVVCNSLDGAKGRDDRCGTVAVLNDISTEKAIQKRNAEFVSSVSHEMKTPLSGIRAYVELLLDGDADEPELQEEFLGVISSQADRLQRLVDNLLNLARMEAGVVEVKKHPLSLNEVLAEAGEVVQPRAEQKRLKLQLDLSPLYLGTYADRDMLLQVAINLLSNSVKYTPEGGTVSLRSRLAGNHVLFEVADTGVGLSPEDCERIFEKFYRVKKDKDMAAGTGLGLPLAKHIVEDVHGGQLSVVSEKDQGSTFRVTLTSAGELDS